MPAGSPPTDPIHPFTIAEVTDPHSPYLPGMNRWLEFIFPEYCPPRFGRLLDRHRHSDGRHQVQIYIALVDGQVAGLAQIFYQTWQGGLLADLDLLGVLEPCRRAGLALALVQQTLHAALEMAQHYGVPALGIVTLIDPRDPRIVGLHGKLGGQIRTDCAHPCGDLLAWYPLRPEVRGIATPALLEQFLLFGRLLAV